MKNNSTIRKNNAVLICTIFFVFSLSAQTSKIVISVPGVNEYTSINMKGKTVLPSGRYLTPAGQTIQITNKPFGLAISPDGRKSVTLHNGVITIIDNSTLSSIRIPSYDGLIPSPLKMGAFLGVSFAKSNDIVYLSGGDNGAVIVYDIVNLKQVDSISLNGMINGEFFDDSFTSDLIYNDKNNELLVLDRGNFRMVKINLSTRQLIASIKTGRQPFGLAISPDHQFAFVANVGMYDYPLMPDLTPKNYDSLLLPWHPYGNDTKESIDGYTFNGRQVPGLGSPSAPEAMSVYTIDLLSNQVIDRYKPGFQIGQMIEGAEVVGGASPNSLAVGNKYAYVTNATNDNISIIDYKNHKIIGTIDIKVSPIIDAYRGLIPFGITLSKDERTLYVALLGFNAIAVIDIATKKTIGLMPSAWGPARIRLSPDEKELYVISFRGYGAGPNGGLGFVSPIQGTYIGNIQLGTFQKIYIPDANSLKVYTKQCIENTYKIDKVENPVMLTRQIRCKMTTLS